LQNYTYFGLFTLNRLVCPKRILEGTFKLAHNAYGRWRSETLRGTWWI